MYFCLLLRSIHEEIEVVSLLIYFVSHWCIRTKLSAIVKLLFMTFVVTVNFLQHGVVSSMKMDRCKFHMPFSFLIMSEFKSKDELKNVLIKYVKMICIGLCTQHLQKIKINMQNTRISPQSDVKTWKLSSSSYVSFVLLLHYITLYITSLLNILFVNDILLHCYSVFYCSLNSRMQSVIAERDSLWRHSHCSAVVHARLQRMRSALTSYSVRVNR